MKKCPLHRSSCLGWRMSPCLGAVEAIAKLRSRSCIIDGEAVACGEDGIASFDRIRYRHNDDGVFLYAFDLIELNGDDLRRNPLIVRKTTLAPGLRLNEHLEADGPDVSSLIWSLVAQSALRNKAMPRVRL